MKLHHQLNIHDVTSVHVTMKGEAQKHELKQYHIAITSL